MSDLVSACRKTSWFNLLAVYKIDNDEEDKIEKTKENIVDVADDCWSRKERKR